MATRARATRSRREEIRQALGVLDAVFLGEPGVLEARQRITVADARRRARMREPAARAVLALSAAMSAAAATAGWRCRAAPGRPAAVRAAAWRRSWRFAAGCATPEARHGCSSAAGENRERLRNDLAMQTADDVTATLGTMKGVMVKLGQMASYVDDGLAPSVRRTLSRLQDSVRR